VRAAVAPRRLPAFALSFFLLTCTALALRVSFPAADPPWHTSVGVVWHDEGAWTHNARNKALFGAWRLDEWNPVYVAPVFTALEYLSFEAFGVGVRQARLVSELAGLASVLLLALGVRRIAGDLAATIAGALLATNYVYVMYNRAAIMEALMVSFIVASWYATTRAERQPAWGAIAGVCATLAFFTKAAAAFYLGALGVSLIASAIRQKRIPRAAVWTAGGLAASFAVIALVFVLPHWTEYRFYNWQMSVTRKPSYDFRSLVMRLSWFPIVPDLFSRMWAALLLGLFGMWSIAVRWKRAADSERLLLLWFAAGCLELIVHDTGNERRFVFLIPVLIALASTVLARGSLLPAEASALSRRHIFLALPAILYCGYILAGAVTRLPYLDTVRGGEFKMPVRLASGLAMLLAAGLVAGWPRVGPLLAAAHWGRRAAGLFVGMAMGWNLVQFADWARLRTYENYEASIALGRALPDGTLVQGKLANGLALENRLRPLFIGHEFGNYADRKQRWDVRYILTYTDPQIGYEGDQILDVLAAYPGWQIIMTFDVAETRSGHDKAALIEKRARD
jgi:4-amino-4-deoxy-L-arabinose transferase-like glycosyltransferase